MTTQYVLVRVTVPSPQLWELLWKTHSEVQCINLETMPPLPYLSPDFQPTSFLTARPRIANFLKAVQESQELYVYAVKPTVNELFIRVHEGVVHMALTSGDQSKGPKYSYLAMRMDLFLEEFPATLGNSVLSKASHLISRVLNAQLHPDEVYAFCHEDNYYNTVRYLGWDWKIN